MNWHKNVLQNPKLKILHFKNNKLKTQLFAHNDYLGPQYNFVSIVINYYIRLISQCHG